MTLIGLSFSHEVSAQRMRRSRRVVYDRTPICIVSSIVNDLIERCLPCEGPGEVLELVLRSACAGESSVFVLTPRGTERWRIHLPILPPSKY